MPSSVNLKFKLEYYNHWETLINVLAFYADMYIADSTDLILVWLKRKIHDPKKE